MNDLTPEQILEVCGPDWSKMTDEEREAYGPRKRPLRGRADRTRHLVSLLAREWGIEEDAA